MKTAFNQNDPAIFTKQISINPDLMTPHGTMSTTKITLLFQQLASEHYFTKGETYQTMTSEERVWMLTKMQIDLIKHPTIGDDMDLLTWSREFYSGKAYREFLFKVNDTPVLKAQTEWVNVDLKKHKTLYLDKDLTIIFPKYYHSQFNENLWEWLPSIFENEDDSFTYTLRYNDFDIMQHMSNTRYFEFLEDYCYRKKIVPLHIKHRFRKEIPLGIESLSFQVKNITENNIAYLLKNEEMVFAIGEFTYNSLP